MPFKSESQKKYLHAKKPSIAKEFESKTPTGAHLPKRVKKESKKPSKGCK